MTTQENILIAESLGIKQIMFHRIEDYHDVVNTVAALKSKLQSIEIALERCETYEWRGTWVGELTEAINK